MNVFLVDLTHGGVKISSELAKSGKFENVYGYDLYNTLKEENESLLKTYDIKVIKSLEEFKKELKDNSINILNSNTKTNEEGQSNHKDLIINPIHSSLNVNELLDEISHDKDLNLKEEKSLSNYYEIINHHKATKLVLEEWKEATEMQNIKTIEITGVKGKTSSAFLLKDILLEQKNILLLSSLGARLFKKDMDKCLMLQKNISITPANIINTIQLAKKIANPKCSDFPKCSTSKDIDIKNTANKDISEESYNNPYQNLNYDYAIFENSLGICGLGNIGILTNLVENYPIAKGKSNAREAKKQVFDCPIVIIEHETLNEYYNEEKEKYFNKINSFSLNSDESNLYCKTIEYDIDSTKIEIEYKDLKTINENNISGSFELNCFAPGPHHVLNVLTAISTALTLEIDEETIIKGIANFHGIEGRTQVKTIQNSRIIEEINPGINTKAIESSINMINDIENYIIIIGGKYGVTCEEIDEDKLSSYINDYLRDNPNSNLVLTDELGKSIKDKLNDKTSVKEYEISYIEDYNNALDFAIENNKNALFIYRSNYSQVSKR